MSFVTISEQKAEAIRLPVFSTCMLILMAVVDSQVIAAIAPQIALGLGTAKTFIASSVTIYSIAAAVVALGLGKYSRRIRPNTWLPIAAGIFVISSLIAAAAPHVAVFFFARALSGLAGGLISALAIAALANASSYAKRGNQMSGVAISYFLAPVLGIPLATFLTGSYGWRTVFIICSVLVAVTGLMVQQFPLPTSTVSGSSSEKGTDAEKGNKEGRVASSLWGLATRSRSTFMGIVGAFFISGGLVGFTTYLGSWLSDAFRVGARDVGFVYAVAGLGAVVGGAIGGMLADRYGKRRVAMRSSIGMGIFLLLLPTLTWSVTLFALLGITAFLAALRIAPLQALVTELVEPLERAPYIALRNGASQLGIAAAVAGSGRLYSSFGLAGVGALCAALTVGAWVSIKMIDDPHARSMQTEDEQKQKSRKRTLLSRAVSVLMSLVILFCLVLPWLASFLITKARTRPNERIRVETPASLGANFEDVSFTSLDGNRLSGWYLPSRSERTTIVMTHGLFRSRYELLERGVELWKEGYGILLYDLRRHGKSQAEYSTMGFEERKDVRAAVDFVRKTAPADRIVLMGVSMGAAATLLAAAENPEIEAVIAESSFLSFNNVVYHHFALGKIPQFPFAPLFVRFTAWRMNFSPAEFDILEAVKKIDRPILFIGGTADNRMPNEQVLEPMYQAAAHPLKRKYIVNGARHGQAHEVDPESYRKTISDFIHTVETQR
jgi:predicted MFS family arabinose efflux permease/alpha-beta hydrolase superfamily lysophospholipase